MRLILIDAIIIMVILLLASCAAGDPPPREKDALYNEFAYRGATKEWFKKDKLESRKRGTQWRY